MSDRRLDDLVSVGPATMRDFAILGIKSVEQLASQDPTKLYLRLCKITGVRHDPCCEDVFSCAVAQARNPKLPAAQCNWWYWSKIRKARKS